jgi:sugar lactone lactonase YvrE
MQTSPLDPISLGANPCCNPTLKIGVGPKPLGLAMRRRHSRASSRREFTLAGTAAVRPIMRRDSKRVTSLAFAALQVAALRIVFGFTAAQAGGLTFDPAGNLFVADGHSIIKYTPDGTKSTFAAGLRYSLGLCFDDKGNLFVSDGAVTAATNRRAILKFSPNGTKSTFATGISSLGLACDRSGNLLVSQNNSILQFTRGGAKSTFASGLGNPIEVALDGAGNLFVVDMAVSDARIGRYILKIGPDGTKSTFATGFKAPSALAADAVGQVYAGEVAAADSSSRAILRFSPDGARSTFSSALADEVLSLAVDRSGDVFVWTGHAILKIDSSGSLRTFASDWVSPDKQWEYKLADNRFPEIAKTGTTQVVLDLEKELQIPFAQSARWSPDSKRIGINYSPPHAPHTSYETVAFFQLSSDKWMALPSPVDDTSNRSQLTQLAHEFFPKGAKPRDCAPDIDVLKLRSWTAADTAILYAPCFGRRSGQLESGLLFTLKFDEAGNRKIVNAHWMSRNELDNEE